MTAAPPAPPLQTRVRQIAIAGNPNCGKSTIFNTLTGLRQKVGNYPGVTVEKKIGRLFGLHGEPMDLLDLPGTYSLQARSPDEMVARDVLLGRRPETPRPDVIICVVDASNLERNLYFVAQIVELGIPTIVALNMVDVAEANGMKIHAEQLAEGIGVPVVPMVATRGKGFVELKQALSKPQFPVPSKRAPMPKPIAEAADAIADIVSIQQGLSRETAISEALLLLALPDGSEETAIQLGPKLREELSAQRARLRELGSDPVSDPVEARYAWMQSIVNTTSSRPGIDALSSSDRLDAILTHRLWGWVAFLATMAFMFFCIFTVAAYPMDWIDGATVALSDAVAAALPAGNLQSLITDGIIAGVGGVVIFLPQIMILFFFIGLLEDTGYMARAAFIIDRLMSKVGLHGKSFIPMLSSFACAIPGVMAARSIENPKDRLVTILVAPLMSCSARLPVYTLLIAVMLRDQVSALSKSAIMLSMYLLGMFAAFGMAWLFKRTLLRGETPMLLLELPPYRVPKLHAVALHMWQRSSIFLRRAGTIILALSIVLWALATFPKHPNPDATSSEQISHSMAGRLGHAVEPVIRPLGYDWKIGVGLISSFAAREVFVGTMAIIYNIQEGDESSMPLRDALAAEKRADGSAIFTPLVCVGLMVFYVLAMQCASTVAVVKRETNSWRWPLFQFAYMTALAYVAALAVYQGGRLLGFH